MSQDLSGKPKAPPVSRPLPVIDLLGTGKGSECPLSAEETAGFAAGDPFEEHGLLAAGKKMCGLCGHKAAGKEWRCTNIGYACPAIMPCPGFSKKPSVPRPPQPKKKGLPVPPGVKFLYIRVLRGKTKKGVPQHQGVVTVAWTSPAPGILHLGFSFCSPKDRWCKVTGRDMALERLLHPLVVPFLYSPKRTAHEVVRAVMSHDFGKLAALTPGATMWERVPSWTRGLAKRMSKTRVVAIYRLPGSATRIIANLKEFEIKHLPLSIMSRMMRDIAALGNG